MIQEQGASVVAHYNSTDENIRAYKASLSTEIAARLFSVQADLTSESDVEQLFLSLHEMEVPPLLILVVNHGIWPTNQAPLVAMSLSQWNNTLSTNLTSSFLVVRRFLQNIATMISLHSLRQDDSKISVVLVGSTAGKYGEPDHGDYAASKSGAPAVRSLYLYGVDTPFPSSYDVRASSDA